MLPSFPAVSRLTLRRLGLTALAAATLALSACGGGDRASDYRPDAILVFGDEHSALTTYEVGAQSLTGATWAIDGVVVTNSRICAAGADCAVEANALPETVTFTAPDTPDWTYAALGGTEAPRSFVLTQLGTAGAAGGGVAQGAAVQRRLVLTYACTSNNWVQRVARSFGLGFRDATGCETDGTGGQNFASPGKKGQDVITDLNSQAALIKKGVLVTVMVGQHDILEQYALVMAADPANRSAVLGSAKSVLEARGRALAGAVKAVTDKGAKVILVKTPNLSRSPFAIAEDSQAILDELSTAFNDALYINPEISRLGRMIAGVDTDRIAKITTSDSGYINGQAACASNLLFNAAVAAPHPLISDIDQRPRYCHALTLRSGVNPNRYVWATDRHLGTGAHEFIGSLAVNRASDQF
jgi:hypothetical protein